MDQGVVVLRREYTLVWRLRPQTPGYVVVAMRPLDMAPFKGKQLRIPFVHVQFFPGQSTGEVDDGFFGQDGMIGPGEFGEDPPDLGPYQTLLVLSDYDRYVWASETVKEKWPETYVLGLSTKSGQPQSYR